MVDPATHQADHNENESSSSTAEKDAQASQDPRGPKEVLGEAPNAKHTAIAGICNLA
jgi:hypothetical protein